MVRRERAEDYKRRRVGIRMRGNRPLSSGGWSTAGRAGRKKTDLGTRPSRNMRATEEEWALIKKFAEIAKSDLPQAERMLEHEIQNRDTAAEHNPPRIL